MMNGYLLSMWLIHISTCSLADLQEKAVRKGSQSPVLALFNQNAKEFLLIWLIRLIKGEFLVTTLMFFFSMLLLSTLCVDVAMPRRWRDKSRKTEIMVVVFGREK